MYRQVSTLHITVLVAEWFESLPRSYICVQRVGGSNPRQLQKWFTVRNPYKTVGPEIHGRIKYASGSSRCVDESQTLPVIGIFDRV
ncbi:hypothetical protein F8203_gp009 [Heliothis virescens ascovirus 3f]|uniref:Uncharacterized protein n=1 Tax=Heliothis virescens ascovirus 3f TaxID=328614 RepID=A0A171PVA2_9VIRU|nr:hypothetical protein F8203_gp009 [Heliothis virescens ascovirus 3f]AJP08975.1 hypothetical protein [Heliothis virescens ascovirus 3f]